ncbi:Propanoyl-CoA C-acyltransferase (plasmid) [Haloterrigena turkmenica DSM 5511]|uniref:Propanoyl-CoA C-acyltransferase n=1 Tax=Haloterrigena turkmenica (strain ATCC 51198 / DSM 5511 / JCM 9101 / NCIMB 13204 / VKM B-1734 / 4k) TaxID=543526 RepID=D2RZU6_HALTV|nr:thiolase domain-containing protein [Haloterrigena turkmenica]ADB62643.1 Propanoyl-CoA C-acyltransferase [Haloterrigena turkmenica DSM 5511]
MTSVRIAGVGMTPFDSHPERTGRELFGSASNEAIDDSNVPRGDIDALFYGNFMGAFAEGQNHQGPLMADAAGLSVPATRFESACTSSGVAVREAVSKIRGGEADVLLVGGMERMTNEPTSFVTEALATAGDELYEGRAGMTFPGAYALMANAYFAEHGATRADLAEIAVKNHAHALENELAQYQREISVDDVLEAPLVADPIGVYDASPITDGASAAVLVSDEYARERDLDAPVSITGTGQGTDQLALQDRASLTRTPAAERAAEEAYADASIGPDDVDLAEVHDCFTIAEVLALESLGFYDRGTGYQAARDGETTRDGDLPVNLSGGLKAKGHPVGATGTAQIVELTKLLRGDHVNSDAVSDAETAITHNAGGTVASVTVHVLEVVA